MMEFFLGFLVTILTVYFISRARNAHYSSGTSIKIRFSQSLKFELTKFSYFPPYRNFKKRNSQSFKHQDVAIVKVFVEGNQAYWIANQALHTAKLIDGVLDETSTKKVDTMAMNEVELKKIIFVIDQLTEGNTDDPGSSGNKKL